MPSLEERGPGLLPVSRLPSWVLGLGLFALALIVYQPAWNGTPVWDDSAYITAPSLRSFDSLVHIWTSPGTTEQYYPLVHTVFWLEHKLWGDAPLGYHLASILCHATSALLLVRILTALEIPGAWLASVLFVVHPVEVESVAWIAELKNTFSGLFYLGAALAYLRFDRGRDAKYYALALGLFTLGLLAKTAIVTLPAALLLVFWWKRGKLDWRRDVCPLIPFCAVGVAAGSLTEWMERGLGAQGREFHFSIIDRFLIAGRAFWFYLGKLAWPANLTFIYPRWNIDSVVPWQYLFPVAAFLLVAVLAWRRWRGALTATLFFAGTLFPALGFVNVYAFRYSFVADHFQYLATIGPITLTAAGLAGGAFGKGLFRECLCAALVAALATLTWQQCHMYQNMETLWKTTIDRNPSCWLAYGDLGGFYYEKGRTADAIALIEKSIDLKPDNAEAHNNLGAAYDRLGRLNDAIAEYEKALSLRPDFAEAHRNLGDVLLSESKFDEAIAHFKEAVELRPDLPRARYSLAAAYAQKNDTENSINAYEEILKQFPDDYGARFNLGVELLQASRRAKAIDEFKKVLTLKPDYAEAHNNLGFALLQTGRPDQAIEQFQRALALKPDFAQASYNLGNAWLQKGDADKAVEILGKLAEAYPKVPEIHASLGNAWSRKGDLKQANLEYKQAAALKSAARKTAR